MDPFFTLFGVVALAFASTNLDNLLLLVSWQLGGRMQARLLFGGYLLGMLGVLLLAILFGLAGYLFPLEYLGYLGVIPILVGVRGLLVNFRVGNVEAAAATADGTASTVAAVAATQLSNGVDTVLVFAPLLADSQFSFDMVIATLFLLLVLVWYVLARVMGRHVGRLAVIERFGRWLAPLVMITVGLYILGNTATDLS